jgi:hypothetical protein
MRKYIIDKMLADVLVGHLWFYAHRGHLLVFAIRCARLPVFCHAMKVYNWLGVWDYRFGNRRILDLVRAHFDTNNSSPALDIILFR